MSLRIKIAFLALVLTLGLSPFILPFTSVDDAPAPDSAEGLLGRLDNVRAAYNDWYEGYVSRGGDRNFTVTMGTFDGVTPEGIHASGRTHLDLVSGEAVVEVKNLDTDVEAEAWLVDKRPHSGLLPEPGDHLVRLGELSHQNGTARVTADLGSEFFESFETQMVVVTPRGVTPTEGGLLYGSPGGFQSVYDQQRLAWMRRAGETHPSGGLTSIFGPRPAFAQIVATRSNPFTPDPLDDLVTQGAFLFFNERFNGNGRTCGTCHPAENNLTIDPNFIAGLPDSDKLFVAELPPDKGGVPGLEIPGLLRALAVILENVDGFDPDPTDNFTLRGVPHTLALNTSLTADPDDCPDFEEATGWSCDGAPFGGSLKQFAAGAVRQHFTKDLARDDIGSDPSDDFRFPTHEELNAMEMFQRALGRQTDPDLSALTFKNPIAAVGKGLFTGTGCNNCHNNAGANVAPGGPNLNFATGVERLASNPIDILDPVNARDDGGFGSNILCLLTPGDPTTENGFGNCEFNTPPLVEAADSGPFFHNNSVMTLEGAIAFYNSPAFQNSLFIQSFGGSVPPVFQFDFDPSEIEAVSVFLRVLNAVENIRNARELGGNVANGTEAQQLALIRVMIAEVIDAIQVLEAKGVHFDAIEILEKVLSLLEQASQSSTVLEEDGIDRNDLIAEALELLAQARDLMIMGSGPPFFP